MNTERITVTANVNAPVEKVWEVWNSPEHITQWNSASPDWHTPKASNDLRVGGKLTARMEAKDGSMGFDFEGVYNEVIPQQSIAYDLADGRRVDIRFTSNGAETTVTETFDPEHINSPELQQQGWQAIMDSFKRHCETV